MAKIDLDQLSIEELADLRERANAKLLEKVAARQAELEAELEKLSLYGKPAKKAFVASPPPKARKNQDGGNDKADDPKDDVAEAA